MVLTYEITLVKFNQSLNAIFELLRAICDFLFFSRFAEIKEQILNFIS